MWKNIEYKKSQFDSCKLGILRNCPICNSRKFDFILRTRDFRGPFGIFEINQCRSCKTGITFPMVRECDIFKLYTSFDLGGADIVDKDKGM